MDTSVNSVPSLKSSQASYKTLHFTQLQQGTASGGILRDYSAKLRVNLDVQPVYDECPADSSEQTPQVDCEAVRHSFGWCRLRFFCF